MIVHIDAPLGVTTVIDRDQFGKPRSITRSGGGKSATRSYVYDAYERLCKTIEPETGGTVQVYDAYNAIAWRASGQSTDKACSSSALSSTRTVFGYDHMNRLTTTTFGDSSPKISRTYTRDGLLETVSSGGSVWTNLYNNRRMLTSESVSYGGYHYRIGRGYDSNGNLKTITYPVDNLTVDYAPNALGEPTKAGSFASNVSYHPNGAIKSFNYGNGITHTLTQNARGLPEKSADTGILVDGYQYDENANVAKITDHQIGITTRTMEYDDLDRLKSVSAPALWGLASYGYDSLDNITSTAITAGATRRASTHVYDPTTNLLKNISSNVATYTQGFGYDARGNIVKRGTQEFKFDLANRMIESKSGGTYQYDGFGRRISIVGTDRVNRINVYSQDEKLMYAGISGKTGIKYIFLRNHLVAEAGPGYTQYIHTDGLGSPVAITNTAKGVVSRTRYEPYGATAAGNSPVIGFTGHVNAADIGLVYMQQRYYDPTAGRFLSNDPIATDSTNGMNFNRYAYASNNPFKYIDADGREPTQVFIGYTPLAGGNASLGYHLFVKVVGDDRAPFYVRAGPSQSGDGASTSRVSSDATGSADRSKQNGYGNLKADVGEVARLTDAKDQKFQQYVGDVKMTVEQAANILSKFSATVNNSNIPYHPASQNSNAFATQAVEALGLPRPIPQEQAIGHDTELPVKLGISK